MVNSSRDGRIAALLATVEVLNTMGLEYWLCNGTLLGLIRDGELIPWDGDLDFGLLQGVNRSEIQTLLEAKGMLVEDDGSRSDYLTFIYAGAKIDLNFFSERGDEMVTLWRVPKNAIWARAILKSARLLGIPIPQASWLWVLEGYALPIKALFPVKPIPFYGSEMSVPFDPESILEYTYGASWRTPRQDYDWRRDGAHNAYG